MSKKVDAALLKKIAEDEVLYEKFMTAAAEAGYDYKVDELSDDELEKAAGGLTLTNPTTVAIKLDNLQSVAYKIDDAVLTDLTSQVFHKIDL